MYRYWRSKRYRKSDCRGCCSEGLTVAALGIDEKRGRETREIAAKLGGKVNFVKTDLTKDADIERAVREAAGMGDIEFLANIAGIQHINSVGNFPMEKYDLMHRIMLRAPFYLSKLSIPYMKKGEDGTGAVGNMASVYAHICTKNKPVYNITKYGPVYFRGGGGKNPGIYYSQCRVRKNPSGVESDPRAGKTTWDYAGRGCQ